MTKPQQKQQSRSGFHPPGSAGPDNTRCSCPWTVTWASTDSPLGQRPVCTLHPDKHEEVSSGMEPGDRDGVPSTCPPPPAPSLTGDAPPDLRDGLIIHSLTRDCVENGCSVAGTDVRTRATYMGRTKGPLQTPFSPSIAFDRLVMAFVSDVIRFISIVHGQHSHPRLSRPENSRGRTAYSTNFNFGCVSFIYHTIIAPGYLEAQSEILAFQIPRTKIRLPALRGREGWGLGL